MYLLHTLEQCSKILGAWERLLPKITFCTLYILEGWRDVRYKLGGWRDVGYKLECWGDVVYKVQG